MNIQQRTVVWLGLAVIAGIVLYPPWTVTVPVGLMLGAPNPEAKRTIYHCIFEEPGPDALPDSIFAVMIVKNKREVPIENVEAFKRLVRPFCRAEIDVKRLAMQLVIVAILAGGLVWMVRGSNAELETTVDRTRSGGRRGRS